MALWNYNNPSNFPYSPIANQPSPLPHGSSTNIPYPVPTYAHAPLYSSDYSMWNVPPTRSNISMNQEHSFQTSTGSLSSRHSSNAPLFTDSQQKWIHLCRQRMTDQIFLNQFFQSRMPVKKDCHGSSIKICEFKELASEAQNLISLLEKERDDPKREWTAGDIDSLQPIRDRLSFIMEQLKAPGVTKQMKERIKLRKAKRDCIKRSKEKQRKELDEAITRRQELHQQIDKRTEVIRSKILKEKRDKETRQEADSVLSEVRRKQNEAKRLLELLESLKELRQLRAESVKSRHGLFATEEQNIHFATVTEKANQLMKNQLAVYEKEEETLKAMMVHQGQKATNVIKKQWDAYSKNT